MKAKIESFSVEGLRVRANLLFDNEVAVQNFVIGVMAAGGVLDLGRDEVARVLAAEPTKGKPAEAPLVKAPALPKEPEQVTLLEAEVAPKAATAKKGAKAVPAPKEVVSASSFKGIMEWMLANGHAEVDEVAAMCEGWREQVPAIARLGGDLKERIARALEVLKAKE